MPATRRRTAAALAGCAGLLLTGCGGGEGGAGAPSTVTVTSTAPVPEQLDEPEQQEQGRARLEAALPAASALPKGFEESSTRTSGADRRTDPDRCRDLYFSGDDARSFGDEHESAEAQRRFTRSRGEAVQGVAVYVTSHDRPVPLQLFDRAGDSLGACSAFTEALGDDDPTQMQTTVLAPRDAGERTFGVRLTYRDSFGGTTSTDRVVVRSGHNLVEVVMVDSTEGENLALLGTLVDDVLAGLAKG